MIDIELAEYFEVPNITERAKQEALFIPKLISSSLVSKISSQIKIKPGLASRITQYVIALFAFSYSIDLDNPHKNYWSAQNQWMFFRNLVTDVRTFGSMLVAYFVTTQKVIAVSLVILIAIAGVKILYHRFQLDKDVQLNTKHFEDLTIQGSPLPPLGRSEEMHKLITCICVPPDDKPNIPILIGPLGIGKTQLVESLANEIQVGRIPQLKGMKVFRINSAYLSQLGTWQDGEYATRLDLLFKQIEGKESDIILFFDEIHNAASAKGAGTGGKGMILETLKTELIRRKIRAILATTDEEYNTYIASDKAFVDRLQKIQMDPLSEEFTKQILQRQCMEHASKGIEISDDAIKAILQITCTHPAWEDRANPRKSIDMLQQVVNYVYSWIPDVVEKEISQLQVEIELKSTSLRSSFRYTSQWNADEWKTLKNLEHELQDKREKSAAISTQYQSLMSLRNLQKEYNMRHDALVYTLIDDKLEKVSRKQAEQSLIWIEFVVLPAIQESIKKIAQELNEKLQPHNVQVPMQVTKELVEKLFSVETTL